MSVHTRSRPSSGDTIGAWTLKEAKIKRKNGRGRKFWLCDCVCGATKWVSDTNLKRGKSKSCGCQKTTPIKPGDRFGSVTVTKRSGTKNTRVEWECRCDCGEMVRLDSSKLWRQGRNLSGNAFNLHCGKHGPTHLRYPPTESPYPRKAGILLKKYRPLISCYETTELYDIAMDVLLRSCYIAYWRSEHGTPVFNVDYYLKSTISFRRIKANWCRRFKKEASAAPTVPAMYERL